MNLNEWLNYYSELTQHVNSESKMSNTLKNDIKTELQRIAVAVTNHLIAHKQPIKPEIVSEYSDQLIKLNLSKKIKI